MSIEHVTTVRLPTWMHDIATAAARVDGVSLNTWLNRAISVYIERKKQDPEWRARARTYVASTAQQWSSFLALVETNEKDDG